MNPSFQTPLGGIPKAIINGKDSFKKRILNTIIEYNMWTIIHVHAFMNYSM